MSANVDSTPQPHGGTHTGLEIEKLAALHVLLDRDIAMLHALVAQETLPQARRRFLATMLSPGDPLAAARLRADRFTIASVHDSAGVGVGSSTSSSASLSAADSAVAVSRAIVDVHETHDDGWLDRLCSSASSTSSTPLSASRRRRRVHSGSPKASASASASVKRKVKAVVAEGRAASSRW